MGVEDYQPQAAEHAFDLPPAVDEHQKIESQVQQPAMEQRGG
jgi:hypothetical protein